MKRTSLKRKTPLKRFSQLKPKKVYLLKRKGKLKQVSAKKREQDVEYYALREVFLKENPWCMVAMAEGRRVPATQVHHKAGRGKFYLRVDTWLPVSAEGHERITKSRTWAESQGYSFTVAERREL